MAEGVGFEPTVRLPVRLISSQVPSTTQPPFLAVHQLEIILRTATLLGKLIMEPRSAPGALTRRYVCRQTESCGSVLAQAWLEGAPADYADASRT